MIRRTPRTHLTLTLIVIGVAALGYAVIGGPLGANETDAPHAPIARLEHELREAETAFAAAFAKGDMAAFARFLDDNAVFMGGSTPRRGKAEIVARWTQLRGDGEAPFAWRPERVAVEANGTLGLSTGPVTRPDGTWTSSFVSTWKRSDDGWRVVLDVGPRCPPPVAPTEP